MTKDQLQLWNRIKAFEIDDFDASFTFTHKLIKEHHWSLEFTLRAILEYKRFIFMIVATKQVQSPSYIVDMVWHMHLLYTKSYWIDFCKNLLGTDIHHNPSKGCEENEKMKLQYENTIKTYQSFFKLDPPKDIWGYGDPFTSLNQPQKLTHKLKQYFNIK